MKVAGSGSSHHVKPVRNEQSAAKPKRRRVAERTDTVQLSASVAPLVKSHEPEKIDMKLVASLQEKLQNGTFTVDAVRIAEQMLAEEQGDGGDSK